MGLADQLLSQRPKRSKSVHTIETTHSYIERPPSRCSSTDHPAETIPPSLANRPDPVARLQDMVAHEPNSLAALSCYASTLEPRAASYASVASRAPCEDVAAASLKALTDTVDAEIRMHDISSRFNSLAVMQRAIYDMCHTSDISQAVAVLIADGTHACFFIRRECYLMHNARRSHAREPPEVPADEPPHSSRLRGAPRAAAHLYRAIGCRYFRHDEVHYQQYRRRLPDLPHAHRAGHRALQLPQPSRCRRVLSQAHGSYND